MAKQKLLNFATSYNILFMGNFWTFFFKQKTFSLLELEIYFFIKLINKNIIIEMLEDIIEDL